VKPLLYLATIDGQVARDEGVDQVLRAASPVWKKAMRELIYGLPEGWEGTGEDIRFMAKAAGVADPHSPRCWGALISASIKKGGLEFRVPWIWVTPRDVASHARSTRLLRRTTRI